MSLWIKPGAAFKNGIRWVTGEAPKSNCSCKDRAKQMDRWGWAGCWKNRRKILGWLGGEARKRGHDVSVDRAGYTALAKAAGVELGRRLGRGVARPRVPHVATSTSVQPAGKASGSRRRRTFTSAVLDVTRERLTRRSFLRGTAGTLAAAAVVRRPAWAQNGQACYVFLKPCDGSADAYTECSNVQGMEIDGLVKDSSDACYRISEKSPVASVPSGTNVGSVSVSNEDACGECKLCRSAWETKWDCELNGGEGGWTAPTQTADNECAACVSTEDEWGEPECRDGEIISEWVACGSACASESECTTAQAGPTGGPANPPPNKDEYCKKRCKSHWESEWDCASSSWSDPVQVDSTECDYCCESDEWEYDRCEDGTAGEEVVVYKYTKCDDDSEGKGEGCEIAGDCGTPEAPDKPTIGEPPEAEGCCPPECECTLAPGTANELKLAETAELEITLAVSGLEAGDVMPPGGGTQPESNCSEMLPTFNVPYSLSLVSCSSSSASFCKIIKYYTDENDPGARNKDRRIQIVGSLSQTSSGWSVHAAYVVHYPEDGAVNSCDGAEWTNWDSIHNGAGDSGSGVYTPGTGPDRVGNHEADVCTEIEGQDSVLTLTHSLNNPPCNETGGT